MNNPNPLDVIDNAQQQLWELHHKVKEYNEPLAMEIWEWTLQIEHAVNKLREKILLDEAYKELLK